MVSNGTLPSQVDVVAPLDRLSEAAADLEPSALDVIGEVVALSARLGRVEAVVAGPSP